MSTALDMASWLLLTGGSIFCVIGGVGLLRMPDLYTRTHAASITDTLGAGMLLIGLCLQAENPITLAKLLMVLLFVLCTSPVAAHALVKAAYSEGYKAEGLEDNELERPRERP